ncbi:hypothetical protein NKH18_47260 [Streptomyces sp. M10(2022)]
MGRSVLVALETGGASSSMRCALVPPTPSAFTAARRGVPVDSHSRKVVLTRNGEFSKSISGFGFSKFRLGGIRRCRMERIVLISPATPAAASA